MYTIFKQIAYIQNYYKLTIVFDNMLNYVTIQVINKSGIINTFRANTDDKDQVKQLSIDLSYYTKPAPGATNNRTFKNIELKTVSNN